MDATRLGRESLYGPGELATAISGLPLLSMSSRQIGYSFGRLWLFTG